MAALGDSCSTSPATPRPAKLAPSTFTSYRLHQLPPEPWPRGLTRSTVRLIHTQLHRALADAVAWDLLVRNPSDFVDPPKPVRRILKTWTADQLRGLLAGVAADRLAALWQLAAASGMRIGELVAVVAEQLGHASVRVTLDTCSHVTPGVQREAVTRVASRFLDPAGSSLSANEPASGPREREAGS